MDVDICTRIFEPRDVPEFHTKTINKLNDFILHYSDLKFTERVHVAVNTDSDKADLVNIKWPRSANVFGVTPWGFAYALNALIQRAIENEQIDKPSYILFVSSEFILQESGLEILLSNISNDEKMLGIGPVLMGHEFKKGTHYNANETQHPWNTCCLWDLRKLSLLGIPLLSEGFMNISKAQEESIMSTLLQRAWPGNYTALCKIPTKLFDWKIELHSNKKWHDENIRIKNKSVDQQFSLIPGLKKPTVIHIKG